MTITDQARAARLRLKDDFSFYAQNCLRLRTKTGAIEPLRLNRAQLHVHEELQQQRRDTGRVRALILKGRQQGCSTYVGARFYHRMTHSHGIRAFILTHEDAATQNLFDMAQRYHEHCPPAVPSRSRSQSRSVP